jgi:arylsulfatase
MRRPNILIFTADHARSDSVAVGGNPDVHTPRLDRLASQGALLDGCYVQSPVCMSSRASFLTGRYCSTLGIVGNGVPVPEDAVTLPHLLRAVGYATGCIGKLHFLPHANRDHRRPHPSYGFAHLEISDEPGCYEDAYRGWVRQRSAESLNAIDIGLPPAAFDYRSERLAEFPGELKARAAYGHAEQTTAPVPFAADAGLTHPAFVAERAMAFVRRHKDEPFFCMAGFHAPHPPWSIPAEFIDMYDPATLPLPTFPARLEAERAAAHCTDEEIRNARHGHYAFMSEIDRHVGRVLDCLGKLGLAEDTLVIFTSDHGTLLGEHLGYTIGVPCECCHRVPFICRWPAGIPAGTRVAGITESVDVVPTLLECAGVEPPPELQGVSFLPNLKQGRASMKTSALMEFEDWKSLRTRDYRYTLHQDGTENLYDIHKDPGEYCDLAGDEDHRTILADMRKRLLLRLTHAEARLPATCAY